MKVLVILHRTSHFFFVCVTEVGSATTSWGLLSAQCMQFLELTLPFNEKWYSSVHRMRTGQLHNRSIQWGIYLQNLAVVAYHPLATPGHAGTDTETWRIERRILWTVEFDNCRKHETLCAFKRETLLVVSWTSAAASTGTAGRPGRDRSHSQPFSSNLYAKSHTVFTARGSRHNPWFLR